MTRQPANARGRSVSCADGKGSREYQGRTGNQDHAARRAIGVQIDGESLCALDVSVDDASDEFRDGDTEALGLSLQERPLRISERDHLFSHGLFAASKCGLYLVRHFAKCRHRPSQLRDRFLVDDSVSICDASDVLRNFFAQVKFQGWSVACDVILEKVQMQPHEQWVRIVLAVIRESRERSPAECVVVLDGGIQRSVNGLHYCVSDYLGERFSQPFQVDISTHFGQLQCFRFGFWHGSNDTTGYPMGVTLTRIFEGQKVACIASGPSLTQADVDLCRGVVGVIAVNDAYRLAPWADAVYAADLKWYEVHKGVPGFAGLKVSIGQHALATTQRFHAKFPDLLILPKTGADGLECSQVGLRVGRGQGAAHSGYQAINLAYHLGAASVILLGYDCKPDGKGRRHFFGNHPRGLNQTPLSSFGLWAKSYVSLMQDARARGFSIVNCSRVTAITAIPRADLRSQLQAVAA